MASLQENSELFFVFFVGTYTLHVAKESIIYHEAKKPMLGWSSYDNSLINCQTMCSLFSSPYKKVASDADKAKKKESIYEAHVRVGLVMTIIATIP